MVLDKIVRNIKNATDSLFDGKKAKLLAGGSRYVLFIGDEGAILVYLRNNIVKNRKFIPDISPKNLELFQEIILKDSKATLMVVVDTIDQSYVQQSLPPVSALSIKKLIRRRLERDFAEDDIKGAVILGRDDSGRKDWNFMMISLERTPLLSTWIDFINKLPNRFQGFYLVAAESEIILRSLEQIVSDKEIKSEWKFFVSHNKVSGFRQVILHKGRVVFTRMAQPVGEVTPEVMAGNIEQEMLNTIEYMRRLSFDPQAGLDVYIITSKDIREALDVSKFNANTQQIHIFTPNEVGEHLELSGATQPNDQFGDVVLAASIGRSMRHVLTLHTVESQKFHQLYQYMQLQRIASMALGAVVLLYAIAIILMMYSMFIDASNQEEIKATQQKKLNMVRLAIKQSSTDVEKTNDTIDLYAQLQEERFVPTRILDRIQKMLVAEVDMKAIEVTYNEPMDTKERAMTYTPSYMAAQNSSQLNPPTVVTAKLTMEFTGITSLEAFKPVSEKLVGNLRKAFPGFEVSFTRLPSIFSENEKLDMTFGDNKTTESNAFAKQSLDVVLTITGKAELLDTLPILKITPVKPTQDAAAEADTDADTPDDTNSGEEQP